MDAISEAGKSLPLNKTNSKIKKQPPKQVAMPDREDPGDMVLEYVCSKGDVEYHSVKDSFQGVRAHENHHIEEYHEIAQKLGLQVVNPHITVFSEYFPEFGRNVATGGHANCQFAAIIDGQQVIVPVSKDGCITDQEIVKKLETEKKRRMGLLPKKKENKSERTKTTDEDKLSVLESKADKTKQRGEEEKFLFFDGK